MNAKQIKPPYTVSAWEFVEMYQQLTPWQQQRVNLHFFWVLVKGWRRHAGALPSAFYYLVWPLVWRCLAWVSFAALVGVTLVHLAGMLP